jgi:hypothetical protein
LGGAHKDLLVDLASPIIHILTANGVPNPEDAVEVLGSPGNGTRLFALIPSERAKGVLEEELMRITGTSTSHGWRSGSWTKPKVWR